MPRNTSNSPTRTQLPSPSQSRQVSRVFPRETPTFQSTMSGLEGLQTSFGKFFQGAVNAAGRLQDAQFITEKAEIEAENQAQQDQAVAMVLEGEISSLNDLNDEQSGDMDFYSAAATTLAERMARESVMDFRTRLDGLPVGQDPEEFRSEYIQEKLKNNDSVGTGEPIFDAKFIKTFMASTDTSVLSHKKAQAQNVRDTRLQELKANIADSIEDADPMELKEYVDRARAMKPDDPQSAPAFVIDSLLAGAGNNPKKLARVQQLMDEPALGDGKRSFRDMFPEAASERDEEIVSAYENGLTLESNLKYEAVGKVIASTNNPVKLMQIFSPGGALDRVKSRHGKGGQYDALWGKAKRKYEKMMEGVVEQRQAAAMMTGDRKLDADVYKDHQDALIQKRVGGSWRENPEGYGAELANPNVGHVINSDTKKQLSAAMINGSVDDAQAAMRVYSAMEDASSEKAVLSNMNASAKPIYLAMKDRLQYTNDPPEVIVDAIRENQEALKDANTTSLKELLADSSVNTEQDLENDIIEELVDAYSEHLGVGSFLGIDGQEEALKMPQHLRREMVGMFKATYMLGQNKHGVRDKDEVIEQVVKMTKDRITAVPAGDGRVVLRHVPMPSHAPEVDDDGLPVFNEKGEIQKRSIPPFSNEAINPETGEVEDTVETFQEDIETLFGNSNFNVDSDQVIPNVDADEVLSNGALPLENDRGEPILFLPGETYQVGGKEFTLPEDPAAAENMLAELRLMDDAVSSLPRSEERERSIRTQSEQGPFLDQTDSNKRFGFRPYPDEDSDAWQLVYLPHWKYKRPSLEELRERRENQKAAFTGTPVEQLRNQNQEGSE